MEKPRLCGTLASLLNAMFLATPAMAAEPASYAKPDLLIDQAGLTRLWQEGEPSVVVLDVRSKPDHQRAAIPAAQHVSIAAWKAAFRDGGDADAWGKRIGALGIDGNTTVVVYDAFTSPNATRAWWVLKYWGVDDVRVFDGGYNAWSPPGPAKALAPPSPTTFVAEPNERRLATRDEVLRSALGDSDAPPTCLVDTRTPREVAAGVIPTSAHSDWVRYVDPQTGKLRSAAELRALLDEAGFDPQQPTITYCQSGGRASLVAFVMELMGGERVANYWGSWGEWSQSPNSPIALPVAKAAP